MKHCYSFDYVEAVKHSLPIVRFEVVDALLELQFWISKGFFRSVIVGDRRWSRRLLFKLLMVIATRAGCSWLLMHRH